MIEKERATLVAQAAGGDRDALQRLIVQHHPVLRAKVAEQLGGQFARHLDVEDVLQEAYVGAFKSLDRCRFDGPAGFYKWLERIVLNDLQDLLRGLKRQKRDVRRVVGAADTRDSMADIVQRMAATDQTPSRHLAREEAAAAAISCLARLSEEQREVIRARYFDQESVADLAARLGKTEQAIHALCYRAIKELRRLMGSISRYLSRL